MAFYDNVIYTLGDVFNYKEIKAILSLFNYSPMEEHIEIDQIKIGEKTYKITKEPWVVGVSYKEVIEVVITIACSDGRKLEIIIEKDMKYRDNIEILHLHFNYYLPDKYKKKLSLYKKVYEKEINPDDADFSKTVENLDWNNLFSEISFDFSDVEFKNIGPKGWDTVLSLVDEINFKKEEIEILKEHIFEYIKKYNTDVLRKKIDELLLKFLNANVLVENFDLCASMKDILPRLSLDQIHELEKKLDLLLRKEKNLVGFSNSEEMNALRENVRLLKSKP